MKAYRVYYQTADNSTSIVVIGGNNVEEALTLKDENYKVGSIYCKIYHIEELPLSNVMVSDLTVVELMLCMKAMLPE